MQLKYVVDNDMGLSYVLLVCIVVPTRARVSWCVYIRERKGINEFMYVCMYVSMYGCIRVYNY